MIKKHDYSPLTIEEDDEKDRTYILVPKSSFYTERICFFVMCVISFILIVTR